MARKQKGTWDISIEINGEEVKNNLNSVGKSISKLNGQIRNLQPGTEEFIKKSAELEKARAHYKKMNDEVKNTNVSLEEAQGHFANLFGGLASGNFNMVSAGLKGIVGNLKGMTKAALAFIATPLGAAIAVLSGIALATKEWVNYNEEARKANIITQEITQLTGAELDNARIKALALSEVFTSSNFETNINAAKSLVKSFGISYDDAFNLIEESYVKGASANDEFIDSIKEYPIQFKNAGFSASEFINIVNTGMNLSIYKDKLPDAIKEADLAIKEQTKTTTDALVNAFGAAFTEDLLQKVRTGEITTKEALQSIALESTKVNLNQQQQAQLTADLFKGAGEDAGGSLKVFEALNIALNEQKKPLTEIQKLHLEQLEATKELKQAQDDAFKSDSFAKFSSDISIIWNKTKTFFYTVIAGLVDGFQNWFLNMKLGFSNIEISFLSIPMKFNETKKLLLKAATEIIGAFKYLGNAWENLKDLNFKGVRNEFNNFTASVKETATTAFDEYDKIGNKIDEIKLKARSSIIKQHFDSQTAAGELANKEPTDTTKKIITKDTDKTKNDKTKLTEEDKSILESKKKLAEFIADFEEEQKILDEAKKVEKTLQEEEAELLRLEAKYLKMAEDAGYETILAAGLEDAHNSEIQKIKDKWSVERLKKKAEEDAKFEQLDKETKAKILKADEDLENAKRIGLSAGVASLRTFFGEKAGIYKLMFGLEKALAINEVIVNTAKANAQIASNLAIANVKAVAASPFTGGLPTTGINTAIAAKALLTNKIMAGVSLATIAGSALKGMNDGGFTPNKAIGNDRYGPITSFNHGNEYVVPEIVRADPTYAPQIAQLEQARIQKLDLPSNGVASGSLDNAMLTNAVIMLVQRLNQPITAVANIGDDEIARQTTRQNKISQNRVNAKIK
jgi:hypothetical protein